MAEVGKLNVKLTADNSELKRKVDQSQSKLKRFSRSVGTTMRKFSGVFKMAGAAVGAATSAAVVGIQNVISELDRLTKLSRSIGVPVEQLSELTFAAELSGVKVKELGRGLRNFARNAQAAENGPTDFTRILGSMGIAFKDASGQFRQADDVMMEVADRFANMEDGANKTAAAMKIFGEEVGPRFVSLLNNGSAGIEKMKEEARRLGIAFDRDAGMAAEKFNDTITRIQAVVGGLSTKMSIDLLPALQDAADRFLNWASTSSTLQYILTGLGAIIKYLISVIKFLAGSFEHLRIVAVGVFETISAAATLNFTAAGEAVSKMTSQLKENALGTLQSIGETWTATFEKQREAAEKFSAETIPLVVEATGQAKEATDEYNAAMAEGKALTESLFTPLERQAAAIKRISELQKAGAIDAKTYGRAMAQASTFSADSMQDLASTVSSALGTIFKDSKAAAIAQAVINTAQGVTKAIATYPPPLSGIMAGIQAAMGAAQIAAIRSTTQSGGGGSSSAPSAAGSGARAAAAQSTGGTSQTLFVEGFEADQLFTGETVRSVAEQMLEYQRDGGRVVLGGL